MTPNQQHQLNEHVKALSMFDKLLDGFRPMTNLDGGNDAAQQVAFALKHFAFAITAVIQEMKTEATETYERTKNWG